jgi:exopolyphosphatase/guanosine-5'-triphosphate,3'-diphosphate pyrophosphatase
VAEIAGQTEQGYRHRAAERPWWRETFAALDLGTNNCRLLVARPTTRGFRVIDAFSRIVRLGEGLFTSGQLSEAAMERTLAALAICANKMRRRRVTRLRAVATEACRRAGNCAEFLERVRRETGIELEIISSSEEAGLALAGCSPLLDRRVPHAVIFDIGGGSTQVSWFEVAGESAVDTAVDVTGDAAGEPWHRRHEPRLRAWHSVPIGVVTLSEGYGGKEVETGTYRAMVADVRQALAPFEARHDLAAPAAAGRVQMLGTSGTVTTLVGLHKRLPRYDRSRVDGVHLRFGTIRALSDRIAGMSYDERVALPCIGVERADLVVAGCAILDAICETWPVGRLRVADRGLREGILFNLMRNCAARAAAAGSVGGSPAKSPARSPGGANGIRR